jgi:hypothetical protein
VKNLALIAAVTATVLAIGAASTDQAFAQRQRVTVTKEASPPMGDQGARWGGLCWVVGSGGVSTYQGYWAPCKK